MDLDNDSVNAGASESDPEPEDGDLQPSSSKRYKSSSSGSSSGSVARKMSGAARYKTKFQHVWQDKWPFATPVHIVFSAMYAIRWYLVAIKEKEMSLASMSQHSTRRVWQL